MIAIVQSHYNMMAEVESKVGGGAGELEECKHKVIYDNESNEHFCCKCGRVFSLDEVAELQGGADKVFAMKDLGLDPHGKTPLWHFGLGTLNSSNSRSRNGGGSSGGNGSSSSNSNSNSNILHNRERDEISILSNIADKLQLPQHHALEFLYLYRSFSKDKGDSIIAVKLALLSLTKHKEVMARIRSLAKEVYGSGSNSNSVPDSICVKYITAIVDSYFGVKQKRVNSRLSTLYRVGAISTLAMIARRKGASSALRMDIIW